MHIALCDDERVFREDLDRKLSKFSFQYNIDLDVDSFTSGEEFVQFLKQSSKKYDLIFLDILMGKLNGIETAKEIRKFDQDVEIVFLTTTPDFALSGYDVKALNYLIKPITLEKVQKIVGDIYNKKFDNQSMFTYQANRTLYSVPFQEINYFEVNGRIIYLNTINNKTIQENGFYKKIDELTEELAPHHFIKCHRSYLVNLKNIAAVSSKEIIFNDNQTAPISRRLYKEIKDKLLEYATTWS